MSHGTATRSHTGSSSSCLIVPPSQAGSLHHGTDIEDYLDIKLTRQMHQQMLISSVISDDPDFVMPSDHPEMMQTMFADGEEEEQSGDTDSMANVTVTSGATGRTVRSMDSLRRAQSQSTTALPSAGSYYSLSAGACKLDRMQFSILRTLVIGTKCVLLDCTQDQSYIQGMCLLYKHCGISRNDRIHNAFNGMDDHIKFGTNAQLWATTSITAVRELYSSKASLMHYCLTRIMHSLDGKYKTVQYQIAADLNALNEGDDVNIYDLMQTYASMISSVGDSVQKPIMGVQDDTCHSCGEIGHH